MNDRKTRIFASKTYCLCRLYSTDSATPHPTLRATCLAAARSRRGSDSPPDCHSIPRRRFATQGPGEGIVRLAANSWLGPSNFAFQRILFIAIIMFWQRGMLVLRLLCACFEVSASFFNKIFLFNQPWFTFQTLFADNTKLAN